MPAAVQAELDLELDLPAIFGLPGFENLWTASEAQRDHWLNVFVLMFRRDSFIASGLTPATFHETALEEGKLWEERVAADLSELVFKNVFPNLVTALAANDPKAPSPPTPEFLAEIKDSALILLYRLLFILYAEDRNLLPARDPRYDDYSARKIRSGVAERMDRGDVFSDRAGACYNHLKTLFEIIARGDESIGIPPYNGGLFDSALSPLLERTTVPDSYMAPVLELLSRRVEGTGKKWINYRDLSVQQLGSIYERLLEFEPVFELEQLTIRPNIYARKGSGSYYTPEELVRLIIEHTIGPLVQERRSTFSKKTELLAKDKRPKAHRLKELHELDAASAILELQVCDPAMGSGHFLVTLVDYLADAVLEAMAESESIVEWADNESPYQSPLAGRIETLRAHILKNAKKHKWIVSLEQLDDRLLIRRIILKRVIHGIDLNPMAVELAKLSLWLHTFTVGAPLSFLDHHLRCGNALYGEWVNSLFDELSASGTSLMIRPLINQAMDAAKSMQHIEELPDIDIGEVKDSASKFDEVQASTNPLRYVLHLRQALRWSGVDDLTARRLPQAVEAIFDGSSGNLADLAAHGMKGDDGDEPELKFYPASRGSRVPRAEIKQNQARLLGRCRETAKEQRFMHWQLAFPDIWKDWNSREPKGGFDAVIGNPPWDRMKLQEVEWFAARRPEIALAATAAKRKAMIKKLYKAKDLLVADYEKAKWAAETATRVAREQGVYPLLSRGDINIYSLFVERAFSLISPKGMVGLLTPSGIAGDKYSSEFFKGIATTGRLACLFDFENRRSPKPHFFPDVDSRFKFCAFVAGGESRKFRSAHCSFFLHGVEEIAQRNRSFKLRAKEFDNINPNTGTAPIFRTKRDAEITKSIYERVPVLVDRRGSEPKYVWPIKYYTMFHMTNDSHLFRTTDELRADGYYKVAGNRWKKGDDECVPLYEGKMVQAYDHRAASVVVNPDNINRPAQPLPATEAQHADPEWTPDPQFWVSTACFEWVEGDKGNLKWGLGFKDITSPTNMRTMISSIIPFSGVGNTLPLLIPKSSEDIKAYRNNIPLLLGNFNSMIFDFITRQKVQGNHLNWYLCEQLPVLDSDTYKWKCGSSTARTIIIKNVIKMTYHASDLKEFAADMGYTGKPFSWDEEARLHSRSRLDAIYFLLYGLNRNDAAYVMDTFPIVMQHDESKYGSYRTKDLILGYMAAFEAGDTESRITV